MQEGERASKMSTIQQMILDELKGIKAEQRKTADVLTQQGIDLAVLKDKHDNGNRSERISAGMAVFAILISIIVAVTSSCNKHYKPKEVNKSGRRPVIFKPISSHDIK